MTAPHPDVAGLILAGGQNSRMGGLDKSRITVDGAPLIHRIASLLGSLFGEVVLVTNRPELQRDLAGQLFIAEDQYRGRGPLAGIQAGLARTSREAVFCVACDMPRLQRGLIERQILRYRQLAPEGCDVLIPRVGELIEPLHAVYGKGLEPLARQILSGREGCSVRLLLGRARTRYFDLEDTPENREAFFNLNTPRDVGLHRGGRSSRS